MASAAGIGHLVDPVGKGWGVRGSGRVQNGGQVAGFPRGAHMTPSKWRMAMAGTSGCGHAGSHTREIMSRAATKYVRELFYA